MLSNKAFNLSLLVRNSQRTVIIVEQMIHGLQACMLTRDVMNKKAWMYLYTNWISNPSSLLWTSVWSSAIKLQLKPQNKAYMSQACRCTLCKFDYRFHDFATTCEQIWNSRKFVKGNDEVVYKSKHPERLSKLLCSYSCCT